MRGSGMETLALFLAGLTVASVGGSFISTDLRLRTKLRLAGFVLLACAVLAWLDR